MKCGEVNKAGDLFVLRNEWGRNKLPTDWLPLEQQEFGDRGRGESLDAGGLPDCETNNLLRSGKGCGFYSKCHRGASSVVEGLSKVKELATSYRDGQLEEWKENSLSEANSVFATCVCARMQELA